MKAGLLFGPGDLRVVDAPLPEPGPDDAILRIMRFAPYGTDIATFQNRGGRYVASYPTGFGADIAGVVTAIGANVKTVRIGDALRPLRQLPQGAHQPLPRPCLSHAAAHGGGAGIRQAAGAPARPPA